MGYVYTGKRAKKICQIMLCCLLLIGCGSPGKRNADSLSEGAESGAEDSLSGGAESGAEDSPQGGAESAAVERLSGHTESGDNHRTAQEILEEMMTDQGFRIRARYSAGIDEEDTLEIVEQKLGQCETLELKNEDIHSLEDLRFLPNLKELVIDGKAATSGIADFSPIADLARLERLYIKYPAQEDLDLSFLTQMDTVTELFLINCDLKDAAFLEEMPQLSCLSLYRTPVDDLAVLENLPELVELALCGNREAEHIESVGRLSKLRDLGLQDCGISDIGFLSGLTQLQSVNLNDNRVEDLSPLAGLLKLERLGLAGNGISDLTPVAGLTKLYDLALDNNNISDISALGNLPELNQVGLSNNHVRDFSPLADKPKLLYATVYGNPCEDLTPVLQVPLLYFDGGSASKEQLKTVENWMETRRPDVEEYSCVDYSEADLNGDGLQDAAFVVSGEFGDGGGIYASNNERRLFVLLGQEDGSWREAENDIHIRDSYSGGMRGDPYRGMWMGDGYVLIQQAWGSSSGTTVTKIYRWQQENLKPAQTINVDDYNWAYGYDVTVRDETGEKWSHYAIAMDGYRMVRVDLENDEHPAHRAFPRVDLYDASYYAYPEGLPVHTDAVTALEYFCQYVRTEVAREELPYAEWQKRGYELLKGVELPDYYYVSPGDGAGETDIPAHCIYYYDLERDGGEYYHVIRYEQNGAAREYRINDSTGELEDCEG